MKIRSCVVAVCSAAAVSAASGHPESVQSDVKAPVVSITDGINPCPERMVSATIAAPTGTAARITRDGVPSVCGVAKAFPGAVAGAFRYRTFTYTNPDPDAACVAITLSSTCEDLMASAYLGSFNPLNPAQNYLADAGNSVAAGSFYQRTFRANVPGNQTLVVVVQETSASQPCTGFRLAVQGFECQKVPNPLVLSGGSVANGIVANWPVGHGEPNADRIDRNGQQAHCGVPRPCPGVTGDAQPRRSRLYPLLNSEDTARCVTVMHQGGCSAGGDQVHLIARSSLPDPTDPCAGYIADTGFSTSSGQLTLSLVMQPGQLVWLQVLEMQPNQACTAHTLRVMGLSNMQTFQYANCDGSTVVPQLNALDFSCFLQRYQAGILSGN